MLQEMKANIFERYDIFDSPLGCAKSGTAMSEARTDIYGYNARSELVLSAKNAEDAKEHEYAYDPIGNRTSSSDFGTARAYTANSLNQYTLRTDPEAAFAYDDDGNMVSDGTFAYAWNGENRMVLASNAQAVVTYAYDHQGRMVGKTVSLSNAAAQTIAYVWDGYNIVRETAVSGGAAAITENVWGLDLDGTVQGAGGVGGLLAVFRGGAAYLPAYDANGNVTEYVAAADGAVPAHYDYSPFGGIVLQTGSLADTFTHRFSTKPWCAVTGLNEYQFRKYNPALGRWMSRDPILVPHKLHLGSSIPNHIRAAMDIAKRNNDYYVFCKNRINAIDLFGFSNAITHKGRCCNKSSVDEWALVSYDNNGKEINEWHLLRSGECVGSVLGFGDGKDCEGMTCGGGFYYTNGIELSLCFTPRCDSPLASLRRWTPTKKGRNAKKPSDKCKTCSDYPPDYPYTD